jgi:hypothetical protein
MSTTTCRCGHSESDHPVTDPCSGQIHYPSEDYPCTCEHFQRQEGSDKCAECGHSRAQHTPMRRCRPASGEACACLNYAPKW